MKGSIAGWGLAHPPGRHQDLAQTPLGSHFFPDDHIQCLFTSSGIYKPAHPYLSALHPSQCSVFAHPFQLTLALHLLTTSPPPAQGGT